MTGQTRLFLLAGENIQNAPVYNNPTGWCAVGGRNQKVQSDRLRLSVRDSAVRCCETASPAQDIQQYGTQCSKETAKQNTPVGLLNYYVVNKRSFTHNNYVCTFPFKNNLYCLSLMTNSVSSIPD